MSITGAGSITAANIAAVNNMNNQLNTLSEELSTGDAAQTYSGLGSQAGVALALGAQLSAISGYSGTASTVGTTLSIAQSVLTQLGDSGSTVAQSISEQGAFTLDGTGQTSTQQAAAGQLGEILSLLNTQVGGNYIFSGSALNQPSVASTSAILNGNGAQAGLTQIISERQQADLGANGLGRLTVGGTGSNVTLTQDGTPFGFQIASVNSSLTGATVSGSPPAMSVNLGSNPNAGDTIAFNLTLPDGSSQTITLQAITDSPPGANQFTIGANTTATAANLQTALTSAITSLAQTALPAASAIEAANNFFSSRPPQRVAGPPFDTATSLVNGTSANTVFWYTGGSGATPARQTATAQVGPSTTVAYGMQANEQAISSLVANVAVLAATTYSASDPNAQASYQALNQEVATNLSGQSGTQSISDIEADLANAQTTIQTATNLNTQTQTTLQNMMQNIDGVNQDQIGEQILTLQNSLSASLSVTARLAQLSLVNYLAPSTG
ncbi:MAG TPA: flagellar biosynthesis protein FlgL [Xanthobacteraceae bacterium]|jgi:flagellin-like hook-associated protein FlgL|nr:flagellar biosynthesis protein FlgL [Xanthobacteraceae bacterium]